MFKKTIFGVVCSLLISSCGEPIQLSPDAILPDGGVYQGDIKGGLFDGHGTLIYPNGAYYKGMFKNGLYHGQGTLVYDDGSSYDGDFNEGFITGQFIVESPRNKSVYEGAMIDGYMDGKGTFTNDSYTYTGEFKDGLINGKGKITYVAGIVYDGEFKQGLYHGKGVFLNDDGSRYEGEFKDNYYHGEGKIVYADESAYEGQFVEGSYQGKGRYSLHDAWYEGEYQVSELNGPGEYVDAEGNHYKGDIVGWLPHGSGELKQIDGAILKGLFEHGSLEGTGEKISVDGDHYKGSFRYSQYDGEGLLTKSNGDVYQGEFTYGSYHGQGKLTSLDSQTGEKTVTEGRWRRGKLAFNAATGERQHAQAEAALEKHQELLNKSLTALATSDDNSNVYFLGVAGDGSQSVFRRELEFVSRQIEQRYNTEQRSIELVNHHDSAELYPMATRRSITSAINTIGEKMDKDNDVLFMYLTSHGSSSHDFYLNHDSIELPDISPIELKTMLEVAKVKWRVIMVSACFSGGFISELENDHTLLMTAADSKSQSFGCSEESEMTYFGKAFFKEIFSNNKQISLTKAFSEAKELIQKWEQEQELDGSNPMISAPSAIVEKMAAL